MNNEKENWELLFDNLLNIQAELQAELRINTTLNKIFAEIDKYILNHRMTLQQTFDLIVDKTSELLSVKYVQIVKKSNNQLEIVSSSDRGQIGGEVSYKSVCGDSIKKKETIIIADIDKYDGVYENFFDSKKELMSSEIVTPIVVDDIVFGVINVESKERNAFYGKEYILQAISNQAAIAIKHSLIVDDKIFANDSYGLLTNAEIDMEEIISILDNYSKSVRENITSNFSEFQIVFVDGPFLQIVFATNEESRGLKVSIDDSVAGDAIKTKETQSYDDVRGVKKYKKLTTGDIKSELVVPIIVQETAIAAINVESLSLNAFTEIDQYLLERFAEQTSNFIALVRLQWMKFKASEKKSSDDMMIAIADKIGNLIHRLNNVASAIKNNAKAIDEFVLEPASLSSQEKERIRRFLRNIQESAEQALGIPSELKKRILESSMFNPNEEIKKVISFLNMPENIKIKLHLDEGIPSQKLFSFDIVVETLLKNSIDAIQEKQQYDVTHCGNIDIETKLITHTGAKNQYFSFSIQDNGIGIKREDYKKIFTASFSTKYKKANNSSGLGYGLWWVRAFVTRIRGYILVDSDPVESFTKFEIRIPLHNIKEN